MPFCRASHSIPMTAYQVERKHRRVVGERDHATAEVGAEIRLDRIGIEFQSRIELAAIIAGRAPARLLSFEHDRIGALFGQMQRGRQSGKAAANDCHRDILVDVERRRRNRARRQYPHRGSAARREDCGSLSCGSFTSQGMQHAAQEILGPRMLRLVE